MPRPLGVLLIALLSLLFGVYAWFGLVWLLSAIAKATPARGLEIAMLIASPHVAGWLVALAFGVIAFILMPWLGRKRRLARLGSRTDSSVKRTLDQRPAE